MPPRFSLLLSFFLIVSVKGFAQSIPYNASARSLALAQSEIADPLDEWSPNPSIRIDTNAHLRTVLAPDPMGLPGSYTVGFDGDAPLDYGLTVGAAFLLFDNSATDYSQQLVGAQVSKTFLVSGAGSDERFASAGIRLRYTQETFAQPFLPYDDYTADLGATFDLFPQLTAGVAVTHLLSLYNNQSASVVGNPEVLDAWLGLTYRATSDFTIHGAFETGGGATYPEFHGGVEYAFDSYLILRAGAIFGADPNSDAGEISAGFGIRTESMMADFSAVRHPTLGTFISFGIGFDL